MNNRGGGLKSTAPVKFGIDPAVIILAGFINNYVDILNHTNIDFRLGALNHVFNMSEVHRWHHAKAVEEGNHN